MSPQHPEIAALQETLDKEERAYGALLQALDTLAAFPIPAEKLPEQPEQMKRLNALWEMAAAPPTGGLGARFRQGVWATMGPALSRQQEFNSLLVQVLNGQLEETSRLHAHLREVVSMLVQYLQKVLPVMDARDRLATSLATTRAELILEAFDRRQESLGRRVEGLQALRLRIEVLGEEVQAVRGALEAAIPPPRVSAAALTAASDARYAAFENCYRGSRAEIRARLSSYVEAFRERAPVVDLGCGRGEFLDLLREHGVAARGVEGNTRAVGECRARGLDVVAGDLVEFLRDHRAASLGGVFAAQVAEHLTPPVLQAMVREANRALRPGGLLVLETVNPTSVTGFLEVYNRDLTHERPLHPDTLRFLVAAEGFSDVRVEMRAPVDVSSTLQPVPVDDLPPNVAAALNENVARLNTLLYGHMDYALFAVR
jgi:SAM-dependent methyltransferase